MALQTLSGVRLTIVALLKAAVCGSPAGHIRRAVLYIHVHLEQHEESMSGGAERRNQVPDQENCGEALPA